MVNRGPALLFFVPGEHREVHDPDEVERGALGNQAELVGEVDADAAERVAHDRFAVGDEEQQVAGFDPEAFLEPRLERVREEFLDASRHLLALGLEEREPLRLEGGRNLGQFAAGLQGRVRELVRGSLRIDGADDAAGRDRLLQEGCVALVGEVGHVHDLVAEAQVRLVRAVLRHRVRILQAWERRRDRDAQALLEHLDREALHEAEHVVLFDERHLDVELGELGLPIGAQVFVAEAPCDLEVLVVAGNHEQLLVQLWALRQREELAVEDAARHEIIPRSLRRTLAEQRRLEFQEPAGIEVIADHFVHAVAQNHNPLERAPPQVEVAIL